MAGTKTPLTLLKSLRISSFQIPSFSGIPNTSVQKKPLLVYHSAFPPTVSASAIESHLAQTGVVTPQWRYTMYSTTHFHTTAHEVLCISRGKARLCFGGEENPERVETVVERGDVVVVPAGVGHRLLEDFHGDFEMVGAYPKGKSWNMCYGGDEDGEKAREIEGLGWFERDPIYGREGPAINVKEWRATRFAE
ncbi:MAG: hypothetical protein MMC33_001707 [Icmadophila ericetorum]|nr:hypothetical protein [Icmadophila ericetorum]